MVRSSPPVKEERRRHVAKVNPDTLNFEEIVRHPDSDTFRVGTTAIQVGDEIWLGSAASDRIARIPGTRQTR